MHTRSRAAATALLLTASVTGLSATAGAAHATRTVPTPAHRAASTLTVNITSTKKGPVLDAQTVTPGNTLFSMTRAGAGGSIEILRLRSGYSLNQAFKDFQKIFSGDVPAIKRVDNGVVFYGGAEVRKGTTSQFGVKLDKTGTYYAVNVDKGTLATFTVAGAMQSRSLPKPDATFNWKAGNKFGSASLPKSGWLKQTNNAKEPHFMDFQHVKGSTTRKQVAAFFANGAKGQPSWGLPDRAGTLIVSPGHTVRWQYSLPKGKYVVDCFWPSKKNGMPHAFMGMWNLEQLS